MNEPRIPKPVVLIVLDGWGHRDETSYNAVKLAETPNLDHLEREYPSILLEASGEAVGLPVGQMGNSEAGHLNLGAGRVVYQELTRIDNEIKSGLFFKNPALIDAIEHVRSHNGNLHFFGLLSDGGVHSSDEHLFALLELAKRESVDRVFIHAFLDGRDTPPRSATSYLESVEKKCAELGPGQIATLTGRYYAMDRDHRWERTQEAFLNIVYGEGLLVDSALAGLKQAYASGQDDEFVKPIFISGALRSISSSKGTHTSQRLIDDKDAVIFFNFRPDRARQLTESFILDRFDHFQRGEGFRRPKLVTFTLYKEEYQVPFAFAPEQKSPGLGEVLSRAGKAQLRIAETEKYAHVTFFFSGGQECLFRGEERILVPSPKVATYDLVPEMSAFKVKEKLVEAIKSKKYDFILVNFANLDMVGHTGNIEATIKAVETVDTCIGEVVNVLQHVGGEALITADHGNAEMMLDSASGQPFTAHGNSLVKLIAVTKAELTRTIEVGRLSDVAPTVLHMLGIRAPDTMTGQDLFLEKIV